MFHNCLTAGSIPLTGDDADLFFEEQVKVTSSIMNDATIAATARALLGKRVGDGCVTIRPQRIRSYVDIGDKVPVNQPNNLHFVYYRGGSAASVSDDMEESKKIFGSLSGFSPVEKVEQYYGKAFKTYAWSNPEIKSAVILTGVIDMRKLHILEAAIPVVMPWFFPVGEDGKKFSPDEQALLSSLQKSTPDEYKAILERIAVQYDMREFVIRKRLNGITKRFYEVELGNIENRIRDYESRISDYYREIETMLRDRENTVTTMMGLKQRLKDGEGNSEFTEYFLCNKALDLHHVEGTYVYFTALGCLENWSEDMAESTINNLDSYPYDRAESNGFDRKDFQKFLTAVFLDRSIRIRVYADYYIDLGGHVGTQHFDRHNPGLSEYMPNPHIENFDCLGDYKRRILECIHGGNAIDAFNYCIASSRSLNWGDGVVMGKFFENVCYDMVELRCYELPDGTAVTIHEAIKWAVENA